MFETNLNPADFSRGRANAEPQKKESQVQRFMQKIKSKAMLHVNRHFFQVFSRVLFFSGNIFIFSRGKVLDLTVKKKILPPRPPK